MQERDIWEDTRTGIHVLKTNNLMKNLEKALKDVTIVKYIFKEII